MNRDLRLVLYGLIGLVFILPAPFLLWKVHLNEKLGNTTGLILRHDVFDRNCLITVGWPCGAGEVIVSYQVNSTNYTSSILVYNSPFTLHRFLHERYPVGNLIEIYYNSQNPLEVQFVPGSPEELLKLTMISIFLAGATLFIGILIEIIICRRTRAAL